MFSAIAIEKRLLEDGKKEIEIGIGRLVGTRQSSLYNVTTCYIHMQLLTRLHFGVQWFNEWSGIELLVFCENLARSLNIDRCTFSSILQTLNGQNVEQSLCRNSSCCTLAKICLQSKL